MSIMITDGTLTPNQQQRINNIDYVTSSIGTLGAILGVVHSHRTGGGFWRGVGYYFLGSLVLGTGARLAAIPFQNKIIAEIDKN
jgi:hypothetical protein